MAGLPALRSCRGRKRFPEKIDDFGFYVRSLNAQQGVGYLKAHGCLKYSNPADSRQARLVGCGKTSPLENILEMG